jgi:GAF domain-containing protein
MADSIDDEFLTRTLTRFARSLVGRIDVPDLLGKVAYDLVRILHLGGAGIGLADADGVLGSVIAVDHRGRRLHVPNGTFHGGPCVDAFQRGEVVVVEDLGRVASTWPGWGHDAYRYGLRAVLSVPLQVQDSPLGVITMYTGVTREWSDDDQRVARLLADMTASYVADRREIASSRRMAEQLQVALDSRIVIEQAKGVLATHLGCSVDHAFSVLREHARRNRASLRTVAIAVVHEGFRPPHRQELEEP